jgi:hypothetical protein
MYDLGLLTGSAREATYNGNTVPKSEGTNACTGSSRGGVLKHTTPDITKLLDLRAEFGSRSA